MEKYFLKVLHEEPVTELSLYDLVGGGNCDCNHISKCLYLHQYLISIYKTNYCETV